MENKKKYLLIILGIVLTSILGTFAWLTWKSIDTSLVLTIGDISGTTVTLKPYMIEQSLIPTLTYEGNESINVTAKNNGTTENDIVLYYKINNINEELITDSFKYTILKSIDNGETYEEYQTGNFASANVNEEFVIMTETIPKNTTYKYRVYTWLDGENETSSNIQGKSFEAELRANIFNGSVVTVDVPDGMIPVTIASDGVVTSISKEDSSWYDYNNKLWANGVLVTESSRNNYLNTTGVTIPESDILAYYVYVPRYKYKIWTTVTSAEGQEQEIEVLFENKNIPKSKGTKVGEYRTHPGFTFGSEELNGIWVGKFETTGTEEQPTVKPNTTALRYQNVSTQFRTSLKFAGGTLNNGHTMFIGSSTYGLNRNTVSHMAKNDEWSAATYLSHSRYGINTEVRLNNNDSYITGCGASTENASESTSCGISYGESSTYPQSTTGNITGIFDMSGGIWEYVMGVFANSDGTLWSGYSTTYNSGFNGKLYDNTSYTSGIPFPEEKYYNVYQANNGTAINPLTTCNGSYCYGHGLSEVSGWYGDYAGFVSNEHPWFNCGGGYNNSINAGTFVFHSNYGADSYGIGFRSIITVNHQPTDYGAITNGLQLYYDGNNNTTTGHNKNSTTWQDLSGNGNNGTIHGAIWGSNYLSLDGVDDWVGIKEMNYNNFTLEILTMPTEIQTGEQILIGNFQGGGYGLNIYNGYSRIGAYIDSTYKYATASNTTVAKKQYHYVGTYDGSNLKLYTNGVLSATTSVSSNLGATQVNTIMALGANPNVNNADSGFYNGKIYMVRIYNRALSKDEIKYNYEIDKEKYSNELADNEYIIDNLQLQYDGINNIGSIHNSNSTTWQDLSGNGNNGTIHGAIWGSNYLSLDGVDDWVEIKEMNYNNFTLEILTMPTEIQTGEQILIGNFQGGGYGLNIYNGYSRIGAYIDSTYKYATASNTTVAKKQYHYVGTYDGSNLKLYTNGVLSATTSVSSNLGATQVNTIMALGANPNKNNAETGFYNGKIYAVRIYNRALTPSEILHNYQVDKNRFNIS